MNNLKALQSHTAEDILSLILNNTPKSSQGALFVQSCIEVLTRCLSEIIKAGYCREHYKTGLDIAYKLLEADLVVNTEEPPK